VDSWSATDDGQPVCAMISAGVITPSHEGEQLALVGELVRPFFGGTKDESEYLAGEVGGSAESAPKPPEPIWLLECAYRLVGESQHVRPAN